MVEVPLQPGLLEVGPLRVGQATAAQDGVVASQDVLLRGVDDRDGGVVAAGGHLLAGGEALTELALEPEVGMVPEAADGGALEDEGPGGLVGGQVRPEDGGHLPVAPEVELLASVGVGDGGHEEGFHLGEVAFLDRLCKGA